MKRSTHPAVCFVCGKQSLTRDEIGINKKLLGESVTSYYCLGCLADYLGVTVQDIQDKIEDFRAEGCTLFDAV